jgi:hypothetical protein
MLGNTCLLLQLVKTGNSTFIWALLTENLKAVGSYHHELLLPAIDEFFPPFCVDRDNPTGVWQVAAYY